MKLSSLLLVLLLSTYLTLGQVTTNYGSQSEIVTNQNRHESDLQSQTYPISRLAISFNPLGFFQYGPTLNGELAITNRLVFHVHIRFISLGLLSSTINGQDNLSEVAGNLALGCGPIYFFGNNKSKPYFGLMVDGNKKTSRYANPSNFANQITTITMLYTVNSGYRFRFNNGLFLNTGAYLGIVHRTSNWDVADIYLNGKNTNENTSYEVTDAKIFSMVEFTLGFEF